MSFGTGALGHFARTGACCAPARRRRMRCGGRRHEVIPHFRKSKKIPFFAQRTGKMQIYNKYSADRGKCRDSSAGRRGGSFLLRYGDRVAAPSVCRAVACILLAAAPTASPCFRRWRRSAPLQKVRVLSAKQEKMECLLANCQRKVELLVENHVKWYNLWKETKARRQKTAQRRVPGRSCPGIRREIL